MNLRDFSLALENKMLDIDDSYWIVDKKSSTRNTRPSPKKVVVFEKAVTPTWGEICYTKYYFRRTDESGIPTKGIIQIYAQEDAFTAINVFTSKEEAEAF